MPLTGTWQYCPVQEFMYDNQLHYFFYQSAVFVSKCPECIETAYCDASTNFTCQCMALSSPNTNGGECPGKILTPHAV